jgi:SAM-dependent methyltransferase
MKKAGHSYYDDRLSAERLKRCYTIAPPRIQQYLQAEIDHACSLIRPGDEVLELGCGYGRVLSHFAMKAEHAVGIDISMVSLTMARGELHGSDNINLARMDATALGFAGGGFDLVCCLQNGISAFRVDNNRLFSEAIRVTRPGGMVLFSTYLRSFWRHRLAWFEAQANEGLLGEIDYDKTGNGEIVCKDGFRATTYSPDYFRNLASDLNLNHDIYEIDSSSLFIRIHTR